MKPAHEVPHDVASLRKWLSMAGWHVTADALADRPPLPCTVQEYEWDVRVMRADVDTHPDVRPGQAVAFIEEDGEAQLVASERGAYMFRPHRKPGPAPKRPEDKAKCRSVYMTDRVRKAIRATGEGLSTYLNRLAEADLADRGLL